MPPKNRTKTNKSGREYSEVPHIPPIKYVHPLNEHMIPDPEDTGLYGIGRINKARKEGDIPYDDSWMDDYYYIKEGSAREDIRDNKEEVSKHEFLFSKEDGESIPNPLAFFEPSSTAVPEGQIREKEAPKTYDYGSIYEDKRNFIQRKADEFYESGPIGALGAAVADLLPGIPWVDIIDPPDKLSDPGMESARNILGNLGMLTGFMKTPKAVGRVATNIREPFSYGGTWKSIKDAYNRFPYKKSKEGHLFDWESKAIDAGVRVKKSTTEKIKDVVASIYHDKPMYGSMDRRLNPLEKALIKSNEAPSILAMKDAREFLYRRTFGLKPRAGKNIFVEHADGTLSFNPQSKRGRILMREIMGHDDAAMQLNKSLGSKAGFMPSSKHHSVMGGYKRDIVQRMRKSELKPFNISEEIIAYEDVWNFKMNPSDWKLAFDIMSGKAPKSIQALQASKGALDVGGIGSVALRQFIHLITKAPHIKGTVTMDRFGEFAGESSKILNPKTLENFKRYIRETPKIKKFVKKYND